MQKRSSINIINWILFVFFCCDHSGAKLDNFCPSNKKTGIYYLSKKKRAIVFIHLVNKNFSLSVDKNNGANHPILKI